MTDGLALVGAGPAPKPRGRPKGAKNKRTADLVGYLDARCGGSAALQLAQGCMVTTAEVKAEGGSLQRAELAKARRMVEAFEAERERMDASYRAVAWEVLEGVFAQAAGLANAEEVRKLVAKAIPKIMGPGGSLTLRDALDRMGEDRRALLPYTDQKQAQRVELKDDRVPPVMVLVGGSPHLEKTQQIQGPVLDVPFEVLQPESHDPDEG